MLEHGQTVDHTTIYRWVQHYAPELKQRCRPHLKPITNSWRVDETYISQRFCNAAPESPSKRTLSFVAQ